MKSRKESSSSVSRRRPIRRKREKGGGDKAATLREGSRRQGNQREREGEGERKGNMVVGEKSKSISIEGGARRRMLARATTKRTRNVRGVKGGWRVAQHRQRGGEEEGAACARDTRTPTTGRHGGSPIKQPPGRERKTHAFAADHHQNHHRHPRVFKEGCVKPPGGGSKL